MSGYTDCGCPGCFDVTVSEDGEAPELCSACEEAGCGGEGDCQRDPGEDEGPPEGPSATAPAHWAPYLFNGDPSGLRDEDVALADRMVEEAGGRGPVDHRDVGFRPFPSYGLACDCYEYVFPSSEDAALSG